MKIIRKIILAFIFTISIFIAWINLRLYTDNFTKKEKQNDIILQLNFLENELKSNDLGERMQSIFPEGLFLQMPCTDYHGANVELLMLQIHIKRGL